MSEIGFRYEVVTTNGIRTPAFPAAVGSLEYDGNRDVSKTLSGLTFLPNEFRKLQPVADELHLTMLIDEVELPLGYFVASEAPEQQDVLLDPETNEVSNLYTVSFGDRMGKLIRSDGTGQTIPAGFDPSQEAIQILAFLGIPYAWEGSASAAGDAITWDGATTVLSKVVQLSQLAGHRNPWMDNQGVIRSVMAVTPNPLDPDIIDVASLNSEAGSIVVTPVYLTAPNVVIVTGNSASLNYAVTGRWDAPSSAPHSYANKGFFLTEMVSAQGLQDASHASQVAKAVGEKRSARILNFRCEPRADLLDGPVILNYNSTLWVVTSTRTSLEAGGMTDVQAEEIRLDLDAVPGNFGMNGSA